MSNIFQNKKVLVTGGGGMIGRSLINLLLSRGCKITVVDLTIPTLPEGVEFIQKDLRFFDNCLDICKGKDFIFHLAGIKGSPKMSKEQPVDFMVPMIQFNTNMIEAAFQSNVEWFLYTSSVGVYSPAEVFYEDSVWSTFPSPNDKYAGWAKRIGELQTETYKIQYGFDRFSIVRPANVYGIYDNFNPENAMVIPSLIRKANENDVLEVIGDGSAIRDFIFADDVARGMVLAVEKQITEPLNLGSGQKHTIGEIVDLVIKYSSRNNSVNYNPSGIKGDDIRLFDMTRAKSYGFEPQTSLEDGIKQTTEWFLNNKNILDKRYNPFINH
jgi:GDP-L-fucose synthase